VRWLNQGGTESNIICPPGKRSAQSRIRLSVVWFEVHQQALGGDEYAAGVVDAIHPAAIQRRLRQFDDPLIARQQPFT
jgi:hypothetical protein